MAEAASAPIHQSGEDADARRKATRKTWLLRIAMAVGVIALLWAVRRRASHTL